ncbi:MAG: phosphotransferase [Patescibacteria group bacterium]|nr:phosphotransferase [Patescibacteria group bacterium]
MIKKIVLPPKYSILKNRGFLENFFSKFYSKPKILNLKVSSIEMSGNLKIFGEYKIKEKNKIKKIFAIRRFSGTKKEEFEILKYLFNFKFKEPKFLIPKPLFYFRKEKIIIYEALEGVSLSEIKGRYLLKILKSKIKDISAILIQLKETKPPAKIYNLEADLKKFEIFENVLNKYFKEKAERGLIKELFSKAIEKRIYYFKNLRNFSFCHNDFTFGNLIYQKGKIGLIDFSSSCFSDHLFDLGKFLGQLDYILYLNKGFEKEIFGIEEVFKDIYLKNQPSLREEFEEKVSLYRAWADIENSIFILGAQEKKQNKEGSFWFLERAQKLLKNYEE